jgi:hypothetical protein
LTLAEIAEWEKQAETQRQHTAKATAHALTQVLAALLTARPGRR